MASHKRERYFVLIVSKCHVSCIPMERTTHRIFATIQSNCHLAFHNPQPPPYQPVKSSRYIGMQPSFEKLRLFSFVFVAFQNLYFLDDYFTQSSARGRAFLGLLSCRQKSSFSHPRWLVLLSLLFNPAAIIVLYYRKR